MPAVTAKHGVRRVRLIMVTAANNNKYYEMEDNGDGTFTASYGRVGARPARQVYPLQAWASKYREKVRKGYTDVTPLVSDDGDAPPPYTVDDPGVGRLLADLTRYARASVFANYLIRPGEVTRRQLDEAQALLDDLAALVDRRVSADAFNERLVRLYTILPRRMPDVRAHLVERLGTPKDRALAEKRLAEEQATLDVLAGQVRLHAQTCTAGDRPPTVRDALGLEIVPVADDATQAQVLDLMGDDASRFRRAYAVTNVRTQRAFDAYVAQRRHRQTRLLWHGSRNENWLSILEQGLVLRPAQALITGKMFGYGLYFADRCSKSLHYTSLLGSYWAGGTDTRAYLALYDVHLGRPLHLRDHRAWCLALTAPTLKLRGLLAGTSYDSVFAEGGTTLRHNEYVVYREPQCTIRYLIEVGR